jgi:hypothetical protein
MFLVGKNHLKGGGGWDGQLNRSNSREWTAEWHNTNLGEWTTGYVRLRILLQVVNSSFKLFP